MTANKKKTKRLPLQKWFSQLGIASRKDTERLVKSGRVTVNHEKINKLGLRVDPEKDMVCLDGRPLTQKRPQLGYWMLCKPIDVITSRTDPRGRTTIYELPSLKKLKATVFPVGRLDYRTEGLLLLSNDGELVHRLMHPQYKVPRHYYALVDHRLSPSQEAKIRSGVVLKDGRSLPAKLKFLRESNGGVVWYQITVFEGRNRIVRRLFKSLGYKVNRLIRFGFGEVRLPKDLSPGEIRPLHQKEILQLQASTEMITLSNP